MLNVLSIVSWNKKYSNNGQKGEYEKQQLYFTEISVYNCKEIMDYKPGFFIAADCYCFGVKGIIECLIFVSSTLHRLQ